MAPLWAALRQFAAIGATLTLLGVGLAVLLGTRIVRAIRGLSLPDRRARAAPRFREVDEIAARLGEAERWRAVLMAEMNHRVKNSLMTVQALAAQTLKGAKDDPVRFQHDFAGRLASLARAHDVLTATGWQAAAIDTVVTAALAPWMAGQARHISLTGGAAFMVAPRQAQVLILALHELATNAAKYGALAQAGGWVVVAVALGTGGVASITWTERGGPPLAGRPERRGFGSRLLERVVPNDLGPGATVALDYAAAGLGATLRFEPMAAQASPVALAAA